VCELRIATSSVGGEILQRIAPEMQRTELIYLIRGN
jgi:hypothetical protein